MFFSRCFSFLRFFMVLSLMFPGFAFSGDSVSLRKEAHELYQVEQDYLNKSLASDWRGIYERQHPKFRNKISLEEFIFFDGKVTADYRSNRRAHVSGGYALPTIEFIKKNAIKKDMLGFPAPRNYQMTTNPMVKIEKFSIEKIELTEDKKFGKTFSRYIGKMTFQPGVVRAIMKIPFDQEMVDYWEKVDGQWYISLLKDTRDISGNSYYHFIPNDGSEWESMKFLSFPVRELNGGKS